MIEGVREDAIAAGLAEPVRFDEGVRGPVSDGRARRGVLLHVLQGRCASGDGGHARNASVGLRRAAFAAGYEPAAMPITTPVAGAATSAYSGTTNGSLWAIA
jgi:hypothetical protein